MLFTEIRTNRYTQTPVSLTVDVLNLWTILSLLVLWNLYFHLFVITSFVLLPPLCLLFFVLTIFFNYFMLNSLKFEVESNLFVTFEYVCDYVRVYVRACVRTRVCAYVILMSLQF